jgi:rRNA biogenesis protein RRP5
VRHDRVQAKTVLEEIESIPIFAASQSSCRPGNEEGSNERFITSAKTKMSGAAEVCFPRGGVQPSTPSADDAKPKKRDAADFLFGTAAEKSSSKSPQEAGKRRKKGSDAATSSSGSKSLLPYGGGAVVHPAKGEGWIESLGFSKLHPGFSLLGVVREIHDELVIFSLPNQWTGFMLNSSSKGGDALPCSAMFQVGEMLAVRIVKAVQETTKTGPRRRIQVTALPAKVNAPSTRPAVNRLVRGQILSVEDHGFLVDLGWQRRGFLAFSGIHSPYEVVEEDDDTSNKPADADACRRLGKGRILDVLVKKSEGNIVALELPSTAEAKKKLLLSNNLPPLDDLQPGTLVQCVVEKPVKNGLCVTFGSGAYRGAIDMQHLGGFWIPDHREESKEWRAVFEKVRSFKARIIAVDATSKIVRLSLLQHILHMTLPPSMPAVGTVHEGTVIRLDEGVGALLAIPDLLPEMEDVGKTFASELYANESYLEATRLQSVYVHISKAMTASAKERTTGGVFAKEFAPSTQHPVRILNTSNMIEGVASGASAPGVVNAQVLSYKDIQAGKLYKQVPICAHLDSGAILVDFGMGIVGQVPAIHLFDKQTTSEFRTRMRKVKYAIKAKVDVRVLSVDPAAKKCVATAKKTLVTETNIITDFAEVRVGFRTTGFVSKIDRAGLSVTFFNGTL